MSWKLFYSHDGEGNVTAGNKEQLISSVKEGQSVKVGFLWNAKDEWFFAQPLVIGVLNDEVFAQLSWVGLAATQNDGLLNFTERAAAYFINVSTTGRIVRRFLDSKTVEVNEQTARWPLKWFVEE